MSSIINLSDSQNAKVFGGNNLVHLDEFKKVRDWISERVEKVESCPEVTKSERLHDTITILGSRGSGKTTFLYSLLDTFNDDRNVEVLDTIDPTLIEDKGHIFLTILSQITNRVNNKFSKSDCNPESSAFLNKKAWEEKLLKLAAGIPSMDGVGHGFESWQDPEIIMHRGLSNVVSAKNLEANFNELLNLALKILERKVFIIAFDDIDINFKRGWPVLETIRKYLTSPYIITLLSGDLRLFSKAIRKQQWDNFGKGLLINEGEKMGAIPDYNDLVTEMEGQYLLKVLRTQRRVTLTTLLEKKNMDRSYNLEISIDKDKTIAIEKRYNEILSKFGINNVSQAESYRSFLLSLPIRTQIQFLTEFVETEDTNLKQIDFIGPFISDMYEKRVTVDIAKSNNIYLTPTILKLLLQEKVLGDSYQLQPTTFDVSLNSSLIALSFLFSANVNSNPYLIFDYLLKIGYVRNLLDDLGYRGKADQENKINKVSIEGLCEHASIYNDSVLKDVMGYMTAYLQAIEARPNGTIKLSALEKRLKEKIEPMKWRIDEILNEESPFVRKIGYLPLIISENKRGYNSPAYSIYALLAVIGELIRKAQLNDLSQGLSEFSQVRSYPMPSFVGMTIRDDSNVDIFQDESKSKDADTNDIEKLEKDFKEWIKNYTANVKITPHLLGKISTRIYYSFGNMERTTLRGSNLGREMHRRVLSLMNAILVEDIKENIADFGKMNINLNNPDQSSKFFMDNLKKVTDSKKQELVDKLSFSKWMLSCPLFLLFIDKKDNSLIDELSSFLGEEILEITDKSIYSTLEKVLFINPNKQAPTYTVKVKNRKKKYFYSKGESFDKTIDHLKDNSDLISFQDFMYKDLKTVRPLLGKIFSRNYNEENISLVRSHISKNGILW